VCKRGAAKKDEQIAVGWALYPALLFRNARAMACAAFGVANYRHYLSRSGRKNDAPTTSCVHRTTELKPQLRDKGFWGAGDITLGRKEEIVSLYQLVKVHFFTGLISTLVTIPFAYAYELFSSGLASFGFVDIVMVAVVPLIFGCAFAASGALAFPFLRYLQAKRVIRNVL
jgi:hypothetical protein